MPEIAPETLDQNWLAWAEVALEVAQGIGLFVGAAIAHEGCHALAARALGGRVVDVDLRGLEVATAWPAETPDWRPRLVGLAPLLVGVTATGGLAAVGELPTDLIGAGALALFTVGGSLEDYSLGFAADDGADRPTLSRQQQGMAFATLGFVLTLGLLATNWIEMAPIVVLSLIGGIFGSGIGLATTIVLRDECRDGGASPPAESRPGSEGS